MPTRITFEPNKSSEPKDMSMDVDDNSSVLESKKHIVSPIKPPGPSTVIVSEEDSGFETMDVDEPKECNFSESIRRKRPLEIVSYLEIKLYKLFDKLIYIHFFRIFPEKT